MFGHKKILKKKSILLCILFPISVLFLINLNIDDNHKHQNKVKSYINPDVNIFDLGSLLNPSMVYDNIECIKSAFSIVQTVLCTHDIKTDVYVSKDILSNGCWECDILSEFSF